MCSHTSLQIFSETEKNREFSNLSSQMAQFWPAGHLDKSAIPAAMDSFYTCTPVFKHSGLTTTWCSDCNTMA